MIMPLTTKEPYPNFSDLITLMEADGISLACGSDSCCWRRGRVEGVVVGAMVTACTPQ